MVNLLYRHPAKSKLIAFSIALAIGMAAYSSSYSSMAQDASSRVRVAAASKNDAGIEAAKQDFADVFSKAYEPADSNAGTNTTDLPRLDSPTQDGPTVASPTKAKLTDLKTNATFLPGLMGSLPVNDQALPEQDAFLRSLPARGVTNSTIIDLPKRPNDTHSLDPDFAFEPLQDVDSPDWSKPTANPLWWKELVVRPISENQVTSTDTQNLVYYALMNSPKIQAISKDPLIRDLQVIEANAEFDPNYFVRTNYDDRTDPVGNTLTTGGAPFLKDNIWSGEAGIRRKLLTGGEVEVGQRVGFQNSNSRFFQPQDQGTATLELNFSQPLLRGRGRYYNQSQILIAQSSGGVAWDVFKAQLQDEMQAVVESYWKLYYERTVYLQKKRSVERGEVILDLLEGRKDLDSLPNQIARARSAVQSRRTELANAYRNVRDAATEIRRLTADPNWLSNQDIELVPTEPAIPTRLDVELSSIVYAALENRPEIKETLQRAKVAAIQYDVSTNELLPELTMLLGAYVSALDSDSGIERALQKQFVHSSPGFSFGFEFAVPYQNRAARSRQMQRKVLLSKIRHEVDDTVQRVIAESQVSYRRAISAYETLIASKQTIDAARADLVQNYKRWEAFAFIQGDLADGQTPTTVLDQLLDSQDRLANAELVYAQAEFELKVSELSVLRAMGSLLKHQDISYEKQLDFNEPILNFYSNGQISTPAHQSPPTIENVLPQGPETNAPNSIPVGNSQSNRAVSDFMDGPLNIPPNPNSIRHVGNGEFKIRQK